MGKTEKRAKVRGRLVAGRLVKSVEFGKFQRYNFSEVTRICKVETADILLKHFGGELVPEQRKREAKKTV